MTVESESSFHIGGDARVVWSGNTDGGMNGFGGMAYEFYAMPLYLRVQSLADEYSNIGPRSMYSSDRHLGPFLMLLKPLRFTAHDRLDCRLGF